MNVISIYGAIPGFDGGLAKAAKIIYETLRELGIEITEINLATTQLPYFSGMKSGAAGEMISLIEKAKGVLFLSSSLGFAPSALMTNFLEYFEAGGAAALYEKNCMVLAVVRSFGERAVGDYFSRFLNYYGAFDPIKICVNAAALAGILSDSGGKEIIERQVEDYYRIIRQGRKFIIPHERATVSEPLGALTPEQAGVLAEASRKKKIPAAEAYKKLDLESFTKQQEDDINSLASYLAEINAGTGAGKRITEYEESLMAHAEPEAAVPSKSKVVPRTKTCKQMSQSLPHYFHPQLAGELSAVIQLMISGHEKFDGYLSIANGECEYIDGIASNPDVTIIAESGLWMDVMKNKHTAQKAFMIGQIKVRGNFMILTKFDQIFRTEA